MGMTSSQADNRHVAFSLPELRRRPNFDTDITGGQRRIALDQKRNQCRLSRKESDHANARTVGQRIASAADPTSAVGSRLFAERRRSIRADVLESRIGHDVFQSAN